MNFGPSSSGGEPKLDRFEALTARDLYRDALESAQAEHGPYQSWRSPGLRFLAARCLVHLGRERGATAIFWRLARAGFETPEFVAYHLRTLFYRKGGLAAWDASREVDLTDYEPADAARIICQRAEIAGFYRDFRRAEDLLLAARERDAGRLCRYYEILLLHLQDKYESALDLGLQLLADEPDYRAAIQMTAHLHQLSGNRQAAIDLLRRRAFGIQSLPVAQQLFELYLEAGEYEQAERCVEYIEGLAIDESRESRQLVNRLKSDLLCDQQRYAEAAPFLELTSPFHHRVYTSIQQKGDEIGSPALRRNVLSVPFVRQRHMTCSPASIAAVSAFLGRPVDQDTVVNAITYDGTPSFEERRWLERNGWFTVEFELTYESVKELIDAGFPVLLATVEPGSAHLQVIVGYDENMDILVLRDPHYPRLQQMLARESIEYYAADGPRCVVMVEENRRRELADIPLQARELYDLYHAFNEGLDRNDRNAAEDTISAMSDIAADHRLTLSARRALAVYDQDETRVLNLTETLLERYPQNANLQLSRVMSLSYLYSEQRRMEYLEELCRQPDCHFLIKSRLADDLRFDDRQFQRTSKLLRKLVSQNSLHAPTLFAYAGLLWSQREFDRSYEIYRFLTCLEDKNEAFADSYFKAARYCRDTDQAIAFLYDRFERYKSKSAGPAVSLFNALESINRTVEGFEVLERAIDALPDDGELLAFAAKEHLRIGDRERSETLMVRARPLVKSTRYLELMAQSSESQRNLDEAIGFWREILATAPLDAQAANNLLRLLIEMGETDAAREFIDAQLSRYPDNFNLLRLRTDWADTQGIEARVEAYLALLEHHPDQAWAYLCLARVYLQQFDTGRAMSAVEEAAGRQIADAETQCVLGHVHAARGDSDEASAAYRRAIELSCDCIEAYKPLIENALDNDGQVRELEFIYGQLLHQVTYGSAIVEFQRIARNWMSDDELLRILREANEARPDLVHSWVALAMEYRERDMLDESMETLDEAGRRFPLVSKIGYEKAEVLRLQGDLPTAVRELQSVLELSPGWAQAGVKLAELLEAQGDYPAAIESLHNLIHAAPTEAAPHGYLASLQWRQGDEEQAIASIREAIRIYPEYGWAWNCLREWCAGTDRMEQVTGQMETLRESMPANASLAITHAGLLDDASASAGLLQDFLRMYPRDADVCVEYVGYLAQQGRYDDALEACGESRWGSRVPLVILANRAWIRYQQGFGDDAIAEMEAVVSANPNFYDGWRLLTEWQAEKGAGDKVLEAADQCLRLYPNNPNVLRYVARKMIDHAGEDHEKIESLLKRAFYLDPAEQANGLVYVDYLIDRERLDESEKALEILERHANNPFVRARRLQLACLRGDERQALDCWRSIVADDSAVGWPAWKSWATLRESELTSPAAEIVAEERARIGDQAPAEGLREDIEYLLQAVPDLAASEATASRWKEFLDNPLLDDPLIRVLAEFEIHSLLMRHAKTDKDGDLLLPGFVGVELIRLLDSKFGWLEDFRVGRYESGVIDYAFWVSLNRRFEARSGTTRKSSSGSVAVLVGLLCYALFKAIWFSISDGTNDSRHDSARNPVDAIFQSLKRDAVFGDSQTPKSVVIGEALFRYAETQSGFIPPNTIKRNAAVFRFIGFHHSNTRARFDYCQEIGVNIGTFLGVFRQAHRAEMAKAQADRLLYSNGERFFYALRFHPKILIVQEMSVIGHQLGIDQRATCRFIDENAARFVRENLLLSKVYPDVYHALHAPE